MKYLNSIRLVLLLFRLWVKRIGSIGYLFTMMVFIVFFFLRRLFRLGLHTLKVVFSTSEDQKINLVGILKASFLNFFFLVFQVWGKNYCKNENLYRKRDTRISLNWFQLSSHDARNNDVKNLKFSPYLYQQCFNIIDKV